MTVALAEVGRHGRMDVRFVLQDRRTVLQHAYYEVPFKITRDLSPGGAVAHFMLLHCTAGLFGGDNLECSIRVERGARVMLTQQSATKIHPSGGRAAIQRQHIFVESGAELQLILEPLIPFRGSSLKQTTEIDVEPGARLVFWEALMAGRVGRGEYWEFEQLSTETIVRCKNQLLFLDRFQLRHGMEGSAWAMADCSYFGTGLYIGGQADDLKVKLHEALPEAGVDTLSGNLAIIRCVSKAGPAFQRYRQIFAQTADLCRL